MLEEITDGWQWRQPTREEANHVLAELGEGGYQAGRFTRALVRAILLADGGNRARLAEGFPGYCSAVYSFKHDDDGVRKLKAIAGIERR
jgi:hypothetical protein